MGICPVNNKECLGLCSWYSEYYGCAIFNVKKGD